MNLLILFLNASGNTSVVLLVNYAGLEIEVGMF